MSNDTYELQAETRERVGKGSSRALRRDGKIPAVIYGDNKEPISIALPAKETTMRLHAGGFKTTIATIVAGGKKYQVLPKDYQLDPIRDTLVHVDFLRVSKNTTVTVAVPVHFENEEKSPGLKRGGALNIVRHDVEFVCAANDIPEAITVDLTGLDIGDSVHISAVKLPKGVTPVITDRDFTIATITSTLPLADEDEAAEGEEEAEKSED